MNEINIDTTLNINTVGIEDLNNATKHYNRYEPTPYFALDKLFNNYLLSPEDSIVDFGCGKGRLAFYCNHYFKTKATGIEMNETFFNDCIINLTNYYKTHKGIESQINFLCCFAEKYELNPNDNIFYFFNPFSLQIFIKILDNIFCSLENHYRPIDLILYYPSEDYIYYLDNSTPYELISEVKITELFHKDPRERFLIYRLNY